MIANQLTRIASIVATIFLTLTAVSAAEMSLAGDWGWTLSGTLMIPTGPGVVVPTPFAGVGRMTSDEEGKFTGTQTSSVGGEVVVNICRGVTTVNEDGTGQMTVDLYDTSGNLLRHVLWDLVFVDNGRECRAIITSLQVPLGSGGYLTVPAIVTMNSKKMSPGRGQGDNR